MDDVAAAARVGKGTLFRRFGDRAGLLRAVLRTRISALAAAVETGPPPLGPGTPAPERITAVLDAVVQVKLTHPQITHALEQLDQRADLGSLFDSPAYQWAHALFTELLGDVAGDRASWTAHVLLSLTRLDLIEHMMSAEGWTGQHVRDQIRRLAEQILRAGRAG
jgi:AcrR family transcriptional regulator